MPSGKLQNYPQRLTQALLLARESLASCARKEFSSLHPWPSELCPADPEHLNCFSSVRHGLCSIADSGLFRALCYLNPSLRHSFSSHSPFWFLDWVTPLFS
ncbi:hypothetical protein BDV30DRAFT_9412 [Aspergillus minisclerotigenes]|uniref:Uncharacterized protein n=1 Tax=Aspergillus minisclerotigenes TaxID=656917 RepID=A0A5N6IPN0_9EURO|nr:hypothetical protein BDV30DRAFT_9412 [Aspergillus minisclerotigenes]